jgi:hypothetical protein
VGISSDAEFTTATFQLQVGDVLVGYTDGITDVQNHQGELWGVQAFENLLRSCACGGPQEIMQRIRDGAAGFAGGQPQRDDMTLVVLKVEEGCRGPTPASVRRVTKLVLTKIEDDVTLDEMAESHIRLHTSKEHGMSSNHEKQSATDLVERATFPKRPRECPANGSEIPKYQEKSG